MKGKRIFTPKVFSQSDAICFDMFFSFLKVNDTQMIKPNRLTFYLSYNFFFQSSVLLCNPGSHGTSYVDKAGLELTKICLPLPPE